MSTIQLQIFNPSTGCWEADSTEAVATEEIPYLLSEEGAREAAIETGALPGVTVRYCQVDPHGALGEAWTVAG
jgi:hypothetical protein